MDAKLQMASIKMLKSTLNPFSVSQSNFPGKSTRFCYEFDSGNKIQKLKVRGFERRRFRICSAVQDSDNHGADEEPPESLFIKELRRRGINPNSLLEDANRSNYGLDDDIKFKEDGGFSNRNVVSTGIERSISKQRECSMAMNNEGLEGFVPRARILLTIGGTFFLALWPFILITVAFFAAFYFVFGSAFAHDASKLPISPPAYIDPYTSGR